MQIALSRIWTQDAYPISYNSNCYFKYYSLIFLNWYLRLNCYYNHNILAILQFSVIHSNLLGIGNNRLLNPQ